MSKRESPVLAANERLFVRTPNLESMRAAPIRIQWQQGTDAEAARRAELLAAIDFSHLTEIFENFLEVTGLLIALIDLDGKVLASSKWQRLCVEFHRADPQTLARCVMSDTVLSQQMGEGSDFAIYQCANGLVDCATPLVIDGVHVANLFTGQFFVDAPDHDYFQRQQELFGFDREAYFAALAEIPIVAEQRIPAILKLLKSLAQQIVRQSLAEKRALQALAEVEDRVAARTAELTAANKGLEAFTFATSHDLKGPLGRINSFSAMLEQQYRDRLEGDGLLFLDFIRQNAVRLNELVDDLLSHARVAQDDLELVPVDVAALTEGVLRENEEEIREAGATIQRRLPAASVLGDPHALTQVLGNLVQNALKYAGPEGRAQIEIGGREEGSRVLLWVKDSGIGFDMAYHDRIFEIFRRLHTYSEYKGSGVGLALVKRAMERMGGRVWAESRPGEGATFFLELQRA